MKRTLKERVKLAWERKKANIITILVGAGILVGVGCGLAYLAGRSEEKEEDADELSFSVCEQPEEKEYRHEQPCAPEAQEETPADNEDDEEARIMNDPKNQIAGGYVRPSNDDLENPQYPTILVNTVPIANMGELGREVVERMNKAWFGDYGETGEPDPFNPETATADILIDFGHEVWKRNHPEEAAAEAKQAS